MRSQSIEVPLILAVPDVTPAQCEGPLQLAVTLNKLIAAVNQLLRHEQLAINEDGQVVSRRSIASTGRDPNAFDPDGLPSAWPPESSQQFAAFQAWEHSKRANKVAGLADQGASYGGSYGGNMDHLDVDDDPPPAEPEKVPAPSDSEVE